ncbi:MAG: dienelactone hydrolase family protein [Deltaproteobacteria bacterium]|nr:MAG: dienelactone hydrolase family protein [Deltaproteobacteria bacterium]
MEITTAWTTLDVDGQPMQAFTARPVAPGSFPGVVLLQEIFGVNDHIRDVAGRIAAEGKVVIAPDLYHRVEPGVSLGYEPADIARGKKLKATVTAEGFDADLAACLAWLDSDPGTRTGPRGCIGFCFGGHLAFRAAANPAIGATASFYGAGIPDWSPGGGPPTLTLAPRIRGRILCFFGGRDPSIPPEHVEAIRQALADAGVDYEVRVFPDAGHGFFCDRRSAYDPPAAAAAWQAVLGLFAELH